MCKYHHNNHPNIVIIIMWKKDKKQNYHGGYQQSVHGNRDRMYAPSGNSQHCDAGPDNSRQSRSCSAKRGGGGEGREAAGAAGGAGGEGRWANDATSNNKATGWQNKSVVQNDTMMMMSYGVPTVIRHGEDEGVVVSLDWFKENIKMTSVCSMDAVVSRVQGSQDATMVPPLASVLVHGHHISSMVKGMLSTRLASPDAKTLHSCKKDLDVMEEPSKSMYSHATLELEVDFPQLCQATFTFHCKPQSNGGESMEEGEVVPTSVSHVCTLWMIPHGTMVKELHNNKSVYIHGMRKVMTMIASNICSKFVVDVCKDMPTIPSDMTVNDYIDVIKHMDLQVEKPFSVEDDGSVSEHQDEGAACSIYPVQSSAIEDYNNDDDGMGLDEDSSSPANNGHMSLYESVISAEEKSAAICSMEIHKIPRLKMSTQPDKKETTNHSIHPVGSAWSSQALAVPYSMKIMNFMKSSLSKDEWSRERCGRFLMGAYNAKRYHDNLTSGIRNNSTKKLFSTHRTYFIQDVECEDMKKYARHIEEIIRVNSTPQHLQKLSGVGGAAETPISSHVNPITTTTTTTLLKTMCLPASNWDSGKVRIHAIQLCKKDVDKLGYRPPSVVVFAMCAGEGNYTPFALSGMRHDVLQHLPFKIPPAIHNPLYAHIHNEHSMLERLKIEVCPSTSKLNHRQRFALQMSCVIHACVSFPTALGTHRRILRELVTEWYRIEHQKSGSECPTPEDLCFMNNSMFRTKRDLNPHWWYTACIS